MCVCMRLSFCVFVCVVGSLKLRKKMRESYRRTTDGKKEEQTHWPKEDVEGQRKRVERCLL